MSTRYALPRIRWKKHRTARALLSAFIEGMGAKLNEVVDADGNFVTEGVLTEIQRERMWAFAKTKGDPEIHYWHAKDVDPLRLAYMLGHEVGHLSGKKKSGWAEELRAAEYGAAAALVMRVIRRGAP